MYIFNENIQMDTHNVKSFDNNNKRLTEFCMKKLNRVKDIYM